MKLQFTTKTMLLATAFIGVAIAGMAPVRRAFGLMTGTTSDARSELWFAFLLMIPAFLPFIFAAYAFGRRSLTWQMILLFAAFELMCYVAIWHAGLLYLARGSLFP